MNIKSLFAIPSQPYPFFYRGKTIFWFAFAVLVMSFLFNYLFEPFNVFRPEHRMSFWLICLLQSLNAALWVVVTLLLAARFVKDQKWTVIKEGLLLAGMLLLVGIGQFLIRDMIYDNPYNWTFTYLLEEVGNTFLVGMLFLIIFIPLNHQRLLNMNIDSAGSLTLKPVGQDAPTGLKETVQVATGQKSDDFVLDPRNLIFAKAEKNYTSICLLEKEKSGVALKRIAMGSLEEQLAEFPFIMRVHRSFLVNVHFVTSIRGNAQGLLLGLKCTDEKVPVARSMIADFQSNISSP